MDEYAEYLYKRRPHYRKIDPGDLTEQREIRERLRCKPFRWFMEHVAFDLTLKYPLIEPEDYAHGEIRNIGAPNLCVDTHFKGKHETIGLDTCSKGVPTKKKSEQKFSLTWHKDIRVKGKMMCWDVSNAGDKAEVTLYPCHGSQGNQFWKYDVVSILPNSFLWYHQKFIRMVRPLK